MCSSINSKFDLLRYVDHCWSMMDEDISSTVSKEEFDEFFFGVKTKEEFAQMIIKVAKEGV